MRIYLVRHAIAEPREAPGITSDAARELTPEGKSKMQRAVKGLVNLKLPLDRIWTSPARRARQTADILAQAFPAAGSAHTHRSLAVEGNLDQVIRLLSDHSTYEHVALVGHEPNLGELATHLLDLPGESRFQLKKGGVICVEVDRLAAPFGGRLCWMLTPRQLRLLT